MINKTSVFDSANDQGNQEQQPNVVSSSVPYQNESISSVPGMDDTEFRRRGKEMIDYIADYLLHIR